MQGQFEQSVDRFSGLDNVHDKHRLIPQPIYHKGIYLVPLWQADNVEIDDTHQLKSRSGYTRVASGSQIHSMWSNNEVCLYVDGTSLMQMNSSYVSITLRTGLTPNARMSYADFNDKIYYSNEFEIGFVRNSTDNGVVDPSMAFKKDIPAGQLLAVYNSSLFVARDETLYISDPLCDYYDIRKGYRRFNNRITMVRPVSDGIYISDDRIWFMSGPSNEDFELSEAYPSQALPNTDVNVAGQYVSEDGMQGVVAIWTSRDGICLGDSKGKVISLTESRYDYGTAGTSGTAGIRRRGAAYIRDINNQRHYINSLY